MENSTFYGKTDHAVSNDNKASSTDTKFRETDEESLNQSFAIEVVPGHKCQLNCKACYKGERRCLKNSDIPLHDVKNYIDQAAEAGFKEIVIIGGEPTLHKGIVDIMHMVREADLQPILCTNGIKLRDEGFTKELLEGNQATVVTHAYIPGEEAVVNQYSGRSGYANELKSAIEHIRSVPDTTLVLEMPLTDDLAPHALKFFQHCRENGIIPFIELSRRRDDQNLTSSVTPEQIAELFMQMQKYDNDNFPKLADNAICPPAYGSKCTMSITSLHMKNFGGQDYGKLYSCCAQGIPHGNMKEKPLSVIMESPTLAVYRDQDKYIVGPCKDCEIYEVCKGGCRGEAYLKFGCPRASSPTCHRIAEDVRNDITLMAPASCDGCILENCAECELKDQVTEQS